MNREYNNLLFLHQAGIVSASNRESLYVEEETFEGTRLVFEWNDGEAEFDLQFGNPENQYHIWKHSLASDADRIMREKEIGFNTEEFLIDSSLPGTWEVNVRYYGNKVFPQRMKSYDLRQLRNAFTTERSPRFKLSLKDANQRLFTLTKGATVALN